MASHGERRHLVMRVFDHIADFNGVCPVEGEPRCGMDPKRVLSQCAKGEDICFYSHLFDPDECVSFAKTHYLRRHGLRQGGFRPYLGSLAFFWTSSRAPFTRQSASLVGLHYIIDAGPSENHSYYRRFQRDTHYVKGDPGVALRLPRGAVTLNLLQGALPLDLSRPLQDIDEEAAQETLVRLLSLMTRPGLQLPPTLPGQIAALKSALTRPPPLRRPKKPLHRPPPPPEVRADKLGPAVIQPPEGYLPFIPQLPPEAEVSPTEVAVEALEALSAEWPPPEDPVVAEPEPQEPVLIEASAQSSPEDGGAPEAALARPEARPPVLRAAHDRRALRLLRRLSENPRRIVGEDRTLSVVALMRSFSTFEFYLVGLAQASELAQAGVVKEEVLGLLRALQVRARRDADAPSLAAQLMRRVATHWVEPQRPEVWALLTYLDALEEPLKRVVPLLEELGLGDMPREQAYRELAELVLRIVELLPVTVDRLSEWSAPDGGAVETGRLLQRPLEVVLRLNAEDEPKTTLLRAAATLAWRSTGDLWCIPARSGGLIEVLTFVGVGDRRSRWSRYSPFVARSGQGLFNAEVTDYSDWPEAELEDGEGRARLDSLGNVVKTLVRARAETLARHVNQHVVADLGAPDRSLGELVARHVHELQPALLLDVWDVESLRGIRPVYRSYLSGSRSSALVKVSEQSPPEMHEGMRNHLRAMVRDWDQGEGEPALIDALDSAERWSESAPRRAAVLVGRLTAECEREHVLTVFVPLVVEGRVREILRVCVLAGEAERDALVEQLADALDFPTSLAEKHVEGVSTERRGARQDIAAMVSHSIKNRLVPGRSYLAKVKELVERVAPADRRFREPMERLARFMDRVGERVKMLQLLGTQSLAASDIKVTQVSALEGVLREVFRESWDEFLKDTDRAPQLELFRVEGEAVQPALSVTCDWPELLDGTLHLHEVSIRYALEEVFLNCLRHCRVGDPEQLRFEVFIEAVEVEELCRISVRNPGSLPALETGGVATGGEQGGQASLRVILREILRGDYTLSQEADVVVARLEFPINQKDLAEAPR